MELPWFQPQSWPLYHPGKSPYEHTNPQCHFYYIHTTFLGKTVMREMTRPNCNIDAVLYHCSSTSATGTNNGTSQYGKWYFVPMGDLMALPFSYGLDKQVHKCWYCWCLRKRGTQISKLHSLRKFTYISFQGGLQNQEKAVDSSVKRF